MNDGRMFTAGEEEFLRSQWICRLATLSHEGWPHNVPVGYSFDGESFYISSDPEARKVRNIRSNPRVCLVVDVVEGKKGVMIQGEATVIESGEEFEKAMELMERQRGWKRSRPGEQVVIKVKPARKTSWRI